jgi:hypothetical protein
MPKQLPRSPLDFDPHIVEVRGQRVMLDETLAELYGVPTKAFNQAVRRNRNRFPPDFLFELADEEWKSLRSQFVTLDVGRGRYRKYAPLAFTEHGAIMAATILNSARAIQMSVYGVRAFVRLRNSLATHTALAKELEALKKFDCYTRRRDSSSVRPGIRSDTGPDVCADTQVIKGSSSPHCHTCAAIAEHAQRRSPSTSKDALFPSAPRRTELD